LATTAIKKHSFNVWIKTIPHVNTGQAEGSQKWESKEDKQKKRREKTKIVLQRLNMIPKMLSHYCRFSTPELMQMKVFDLSLICMTCTSSGVSRQKYLLRKGKCFQK